METVDTPALSTALFAGKKPKPAGKRLNLF
jgi:hypothetical protein